MNEPNVVLVPTGAANLASVRAALGRAGASVREPQRATDIDAAPFVVLPGVGAFAAARERLVARGYWEPLARRLRDGRPTLAVCLGLQLLTEGSDESPGIPGMGLVPGRVTRFPNGLRVPQMGWNRVEAPFGSLLGDGSAYFANTYRLVDAPEGWAVTRSDYGGRFVAALERGGVLACQFHPELSGAWGRTVITRWLREAPLRAGEASCSRSG